MSYFWFLLFIFGLFFKSSTKVHGSNLDRETAAITGTPFKQLRNIRHFEVSALNCFCHHEALIKASTLNDPTVFDVIDLLSKRFSQCRTLANISRACGDNPAEEDAVDDFAADKFNKDVCLKMAAKHDANRWKTLKGQLDSFAASLHLRMCVPNGLTTLSIDEISGRLHGFMCSFFDEWLQESGECRLSRDCRDWSGDATGGENGGSGGEGKAVGSNRNLNIDNRTTVDDKDSVKRRYTRSAHSPVINVSLSIAEPLTCVCKTPSLDDVLDLALDNEDNADKYEDENADDDVGKDDDTNKNHSEGDKRKEKLTVMKPSILEILRKCDEAHPGNDICLEVDGKFLLPMTKLLASSSSSSSSALSNARVTIATKFILRICDVPLNASAAERLFRIESVCQKYGSSVVVCREVPCQNVFCSEEEEEERKSDESSKSVGTGVVRGAVWPGLLGAAAFFNFALFLYD